MMFDLVFVWIAGIAGVLIMRKIEPGNKIYPVWVLLTEVVFTAVTIRNGCL